ncbi:probable magnesium transporter NIPA6 isoform X1 [Chenopodium quinoa]|uniref:probable magnesium transporter NIPA6 isoform X1 n=1 Tax=Chenopodium quinoa TaxID=63459 RepID=UPI000B77CE03|nr:probable magnesium transporter NIPA6 isoform X1 [Chenopodium quinoa]
MYSSNLKGVILTCVSSAFIGSSFIIKKKGLKRAGVAGPRAGNGGYGYLMEPLWWVGMGTMIVGEIANFVAYIYAPAVLVTPLGALSIIVSAVLAHCILDEKLQKMGMLGCLLCIVGSVVIVLHAPGERSMDSVDEIWALAIQPAFLLYTASIVAVALVLIMYCAPRYGQTNILIYIGICSIIGSLTVMSVKAIGIAIKLTLDGANQFKYLHAWIFAMVSVTCIIIQLNYLNMALDTFNTALVSPIYYALFTSFTILASAIMFQELQSYIVQESLISRSLQIYIRHSLQKYHGICKVMESSGSKGMKMIHLLTVSQSSGKITSIRLNVAEKRFAFTGCPTPQRCSFFLQEA